MVAVLPWMHVEVSYWPLYHRISKIKRKRKEKKRRWGVPFRFASCVDLLLATFGPLFCMMCIRHDGRFMLASCFMLHFSFVS